MIIFFLSVYTIKDIKKAISYEQVWKTWWSYLNSENVVKMSIPG